MGKNKKWREANGIKTPSKAPYEPKKKEESTKITDEYLEELRKSEEERGSAKSGMSLYKFMKALKEQQDSEDNK